AGFDRDAEFWKACDGAGIDWLGFADSPALSRDVYVTSALCAQQTKRIKVASMVTNPVSRDPSVTACAVFSLDHLAPGRIVLGIATGDSALWATGQRMPRVDALREYILAVKALLRGETATYGERSFRVSWAPPEVKVPVYVACAGPKVLRMSAQVADGVVLA